MSRPAPNHSTPALEINVYEREDISYQGRRRLVQRVFVEIEAADVREGRATVADEVLKAIVRARWAEEREHYDEVTVFFYLRSMHPHRWAYAVGEITEAGLRFWTQPEALDEEADAAEIIEAARKRGTA